jgi:hypothetical protein
MKIRTFLLGVVLACSVASAQAQEFTVAEFNTQDLLRSVSTLSLINWKVGDSQDYKVVLSGFGMEGTLAKVATKEENNGTAIWVKNEMKLPIMNDTQEILFDRNTAKVLKYIHNGKEEQLPDDKIEIVETKNEEVTVPAGTFKSTHVIAKSKQVKQIDIWINPRDISLDGAAKMFMDQGQVKITMELTKFTKN